jgi:hypothetical protein
MILECPNCCEKFYHTPKISDGKEYMICEKCGSQLQIDIIEQGAIVCVVETKKTTIQKNSDTNRYPKEKVLEILSNAMPHDICIGDALKGAILFLADIIDQSDHDGKRDTLGLAKNMLECEVIIIRKRLNC